MQSRTNRPWPATWSRKATVGGRPSEGARHAAFFLSHCSFLVFEHRGSGGRDARSPCCHRHRWRRGSCGATARVLTKAHGAARQGDCAVSSGRQEPLPMAQGRKCADKSMNARSGVRPTPRLYVVTPAVSDPAALAVTLNEMFGAADVAAVLLRLQETDERSLINRVKAAAPGVQAAGAALLLDGRPGIVARAGA